MNEYNLSEKEWTEHQRLWKSVPIKKWPKWVRDGIDQKGWTIQTSGQTLAQTLADVLRGKVH